MATSWDTEYKDKSSYLMYQTKDELVIKVSLPRDAKPEQVYFTFNGRSVTISCDATFEKPVSKGSVFTRETYYYPVFTHSIPLVGIPVDTKEAKVDFRGDMWTLTIPKKKG